MESYIVRIYRREKTDPSQLAGQVEDVSDGGVHPFTSANNLGEIFTHKTAKTAASSGQPKGGRGLSAAKQAISREPP